jgi:uncharacterized protein YbjT (DUF2867 family)/nitrite reductase/ring-hydroxylating ferredoxin subunit
MNIIVIGGTGLIGSKLVTTLREQGHDANAVQSFAGVLTPAPREADVVIDVSDPPGCEDAAFEAAAAAGVRHYVGLSAVGIEELAESDYFRARCVQERLITACGMPFSIVRTTQIFEQLGGIADAETDGVTVRVPPALIQPIAADDIVRVLAEIAVGDPLNATIEVGGPEPFYLDGLLQRILGARNDPRRVIDDVHARYLGAAVGPRSLMAGDEARLGAIRFDDWLRHAPSAPECPKKHEFRVSDVPPGSVLLLGDVAVFSAAGGFCATQALCTHRAGPLSEGAVDDTSVTCPLHGARFDIWTGAVLGGPATEPLKTYRVCIDGDIGRVELEVEVDS